MFTRVAAKQSSNANSSLKWGLKCSPKCKNCKEVKNKNMGDIIYPKGGDSETDAWEIFHQTKNHEDLTSRLMMSQNLKEH